VDDEEDEQSVARSCRRLAEERLAEVREAVATEAGRVPRNATLVAIGLAAAAGLALALRGRLRRGRRR